MTEFFLIAHKVRGEVAFDVATEIQIGQEVGWVIPTSGHRAYPICNWRLDSLVDYQPHCDWQPDILTEVGPIEFKDGWESLRDHYQSEAQAPVKQGKFVSLNLADLGL